VRRFFVPRRRLGFLLGEFAEALFFYIGSDAARYRRAVVGCGEFF